MPRHNRRRPERELRPLPGGGPERREEWRGLLFTVRGVAAGQKTYRCPGCDQQIRPGTGHVVAWPADDPDDRRHWHSPCWAARDRRGPVVRPSSSRNRPAPRY